ncbi:uncharacterized protein LOC126845075 [Adelges cooleyi]|uniref:uncharacterized protein LOC126845075 n=1 Tax=Adelges cooleyi TaxID=133065 RepID=UPI0021808167|nr:uncharacterized protein LOC126845075 [Adelges cooleyi]
MVELVSRNNTEVIRSTIKRLKKHIIIFVFTLLVVISILNLSKHPNQILPLIFVTIVLFSAVYYTTVLILKFVTAFAANQLAEETMNADNDQTLKTPDRPYPTSPTPPPSYEEATKNDNAYYQPHQPLPSTSSQATGGMPFVSIFNQSRIVPTGGDSGSTSQANTQNKGIDSQTTSVTRGAVQTIPCVTITAENDQPSTLEF